MLCYLHPGEYEVDIINLFRGLRFNKYFLFYFSVYGYPTNSICKTPSKKVAVVHLWLKGKVQTVEGYAYTGYAYE